MSDFDAYPCSECGAPAWAACSPWWSCAARGAAFDVGERRATCVWWFALGAFATLEASEDQELSAGIDVDAQQLVFALSASERACCCFSIPGDEP